MKHLALLGSRLVLGGYLAVHGAQKLFGVLGGHGLEGTGRAFEAMGLGPGPQMAKAAAITELGGGLLTITGAGHPLGPMAIAGSMGVAAASHHANGPLARDGGYELPLTNVAAALALAAAGPGRLAIGNPLVRPARWLVTIGAVAGSAYLAQRILRPVPEAGEDEAPTLDLTDAGTVATATAEDRMATAFGDARV